MLSVYLKNSWTTERCPIPEYAIIQDLHSQTTRLSPQHRNPPATKPGVVKGRRLVEEAMAVYERKMKGRKLKQSKARGRTQQWTESMPLAATHCFQFIL